MRHVALYVRDLPCPANGFYVSLLGMQVEWRPDPANVYSQLLGRIIWRCTRLRLGERDESQQRLDHIGFFLATKAAVDEWFAFLQAEGVQMRTEPRTHRDGARSFYCL